MKILLYILPVSILMSYSQLVAKWRATHLEANLNTHSFIVKIIHYFSDPYVLSACFIGLIASFLWLIVITKIPLSIGFPIYIGTTFILVMLGSFLFLGEIVTKVQLIAQILIFVGILLGSLD
jgi:multidrug transporter EmrE-like cation transporter